ncbi:MAG: hypothetical protein P4L73_17935 [Caulobacteraceae bacterium]|nr:hypothetical protein [Caulobacteraceae bacterium]
MACEYAKWRKRLVRLALCLGAAAGAAGCAGASRLNPMSVGRIDPNSAVAADIATAERTPGPYPKFSHVPPIPKDVRPATAWRDSVADAWGLKRQSEADAAAIPFTLPVGQAGAWADAERAKIPASEMASPPADAGQQAEAFAAAARARATPPPPPK